MGNMTIYDHVRSVPAEAKKEIKGGRLAGKTDINPMWRIKALTEQFGPCGVGWKYELVMRELCQGAGGEIAAFVDINLYIKQGDAWSEAIPGTGGSMFVSNEKNGAYTSDECFKMALTDAISVSCKALGVAADVYWEKDGTKYDRPPLDDKPGNRNPPKGDDPVMCEDCKLRIADYWDGKNLIKAADAAKRSKERYGAVLCVKCAKTKRGDGA